MTGLAPTPGIEHSTGLAEAKSIASIRRIHSRQRSGQFAVKLRFLAPRPARPWGGAAEGESA